MKELEAARKAYELRQRRKAERDPLVAAVLERFPGAEVVRVTEKNDEPSDSAR